MKKTKSTRSFENSDMAQLAEKDACELLDADHIAVKHLFVEYARSATAAASPAATDDGVDRHAIALQICNELTVHAQIEEELFYPALRKAVPDAADVLDEAMAEHNEAKEMIAQLQSMSAADKVMDALVAKLNWAIEHHVKEERDELFPKARAAKGLDLEALGAQLRERQMALQSEAAPAKGT
jgi:iron-sulfur cluster repair protein YtfE (RIC family)